MSHRFAESTRSDAGTPGPRMRAGRSVVLVALALCLPAAPARAEMATILQDDAQLLHRPEDEVRASMQEIGRLGIGWVRLTAGWSVIAPAPDAAARPDFDAADPDAYPPGVWEHLDRAVRLARDARLEPLIDVAFWAPRWATSAPADQVGRLRTEIDPGEYALFARAVARRYSGSFAPKPTVAAPAEPPPSPDRAFLDALMGGRKDPVKDAPMPRTPLPKVTHYTIWNEPNHPGFILPQWSFEDGRWVAHSADVYRRLVQASYPAIKEASPSATVLIGGTASGGSRHPPKGGVPPLAFLRRLACVDEQLRPISDGACAGFTTVPGDGYAHHPYSLRTRPDQLPRRPDDLPVAATPKLTRTLRALVGAGRLGQGAQDVYMTEYGYETKPASPVAIWSVQEQARFLPWAEYIASRDPAVRMWPQFLLRDMPIPPGVSPRGLHHVGSWQSGLFHADGTPKAAAAGFRAPAVALCRGRRGRRSVMVWGRLRGQAGPATATIESTGGSPRPWAAVATSASRSGRLAAHGAGPLVLHPGEELIRYAPFVRRRALRIRWSDGEGTHTSTSLRPIGCGRTPGQ